MKNSTVRVSNDPPEESNQREHMARRNGFEEQARDGKEEGVGKRRDGGGGMEIDGKGRQAEEKGDREEGREGG